MLVTGGTGREWEGGYGNSLYLLVNFYVNLKLICIIKSMNFYKCMSHPNCLGPSPALHQSPRSHDTWVLDHMIPSAWMPRLNIWGPPPPIPRLGSPAVSPFVITGLFSFSGGRCCMRVWGTQVPWTWMGAVFFFKSSFWLTDLCPDCSGFTRMSWCYFP